MTETERYLRRRAGVWHVDFTLPSDTGEGLGGLRVRFSLLTGDIVQARAFRDSYVMPLLHASRTNAAMRVAVDQLSATSATMRYRANELLARAGLAQLGPLRGTTGTLGSLIDVYASYLGHTGMTPATVRAKVRSCEQALRILGEDHEPEHTTDADMAMIRDVLLSTPAFDQQRTATTDRGAARKPSTVNRELTAIRAMYKWAMAEGRLTFRRAVPGVGVRCQSGRVEAHKACPPPADAGQLCMMQCPSTLDPYAWRAMPVIARYTGMRAGEIAMLYGEDLVEVEGLLCVRVCRHLKTQAAERLVPVADVLEPTVLGLLARTRQGRLFGGCGDYTDPKGQMHPGLRLIQSFGKRAKDVGPYSFHCLRVYANSEMARAGVDIIDRELILGHKSTRVQAAYTPRDLERLRKAVNGIR